MRPLRAIAAIPALLSLAVLTPGTAFPAMAAIIPIHGHHHAPAQPPVHLTGGGHACTATNPEALIVDDDMAGTTRPGTTGFTGTWIPGHRWEGLYAVLAGWHDESPALCDNRELPGSGGYYGQSYTLRYRVWRRPRITVSMRAHGDGRLGFDLWFTADPRETTAAAMEHDPRTVEVLLQQGHGWHVFRDDPGWNRYYVSVLPGHGDAISFDGLNLTRIITRLGVPGRLYWMAIDAGGETPRGSFAVDRVALRIAGQHPMAWKPDFGPPIVTRGHPARSRPQDNSHYYTPAGVR